MILNNLGIPLNSVPDNLKSEKLASELYYDLKDKYIDLKEEYTSLRKNYVRKSKELSIFKNKGNNLYILRFGRKQFNFAVSLMSKEIERYAKENNLDLNHAVELVKLLNNIKRPPIVNNYVKSTESNDKSELRTT